MTINFGNKIKDLREKRQMTQTELAQKINVSKSVISAYEKGIRTPSYKVLKDMCDVFGITEADFIGETDTLSKVLIDISDLTLSQQRIIYALLNEFKEVNEKGKV